MNAGFDDGGATCWRSRRGTPHEASRRLQFGSCCDALGDVSQDSVAIDAQGQRIPFRTWCAATAFGLVAAAIVLFLTRGGVGLLNDSRDYLEMAQHLSLSPAPLPAFDAREPISRHYPPGYPWLLSFAPVLGIDYMTFARWLNAGLMFVSTLLVAKLVWSITRSMPRTVLGIALYVLSAGAIQAHLCLLSEATFQTLALMTTLACGSYVAAGRLRWLLVTAALVTLAVLVRYAGVALVMSVAVVLLLSGARSIRRRMLDAAVVGLLPFAALVLWSRLGGYSGAGDRSFAFNPMRAETIREGFAELGSWIVWSGGHETVLFVTGAIEIVFIAWLLWLGRRAWRLTDERSRRLALPMVFTLVYPAFLLVSIHFFDSLTPLSDRILLPLHVMVIALGCSLFPLRAWWGRAGVALLLILQTATFGMFLAEARETRLGYKSRVWQASPIVVALKSFPPDATVYANSRSAIELASGRPVRPLPYLSASAPRDTISGRARQFAAELDQAKGRRFIVYLQRSRDVNRLYLGPDELGEAWRFTEVARAFNGKVFEVTRIEPVPTSQPASKRRARRQ